MRTALVLGGAGCVWADAGEALERFNPTETIAVNDIGALWPGPIDAWVTLHYEKMADWREKRRLRGLPQASEHVGHREHHAIDRVAAYAWPEMNASGSSGLYAVKIALERGADQVVLAGVPMTSEGAHFFDASRWGERDAFTGAWMLVRHRIKDCVRSMSGWTKELLGAPSPEWLAGDPQV